MADTVRMLLCVNDGNTGTPTGRCDALEIPDVLTLHADLEVGGPDCFIDAEPRLHLMGRTFPILRVRYGVGNWCWDEVTVTTNVALEILALIREDEVWSLEEAEVIVYERWERGESITADDLKWMAI